MPPILLVDTGPLVATADESDPQHAQCAELLLTFPGTLLVPWPVVTETGWLLEKYHGPDAEAELLLNIRAGRLDTVAPTHEDVARMAELIRQYADFPLGQVDASVVAIAERLSISSVATLDRRHFSAIRPRHVDHLKLLP